jgi:hypothetical protein
MRYTGLLISVSISVVIGIISLFVAILSGGAGHGDYFWAWVLFPFTMSLAFPITTPLIVLAIVQFPIYGVVVGLASLKGKTIHALLCVAAVHLLGVGTFIGLSQYVPRDVKFMEAVRDGNASTVVQFLDAGVDPNLNSIHYNVRPLDLACSEGHLDVVKILCERGANINYADEALGNTPLISAVLFGQQETVQYMLAKGADIKIKDSSGHTALEWARKSQEPPFKRATDAKILALLEAAEKGEKIREP